MLVWLLGEGEKPKKKRKIDQGPAPESNEVPAELF
jgi:hypothetical protein